MVGALIFWALALYGAILVVYQSVIAIIRRTQLSREIVYFVVTHNAEERVEGVLRNLVLRALFDANRRRIIVVDIASTDDTSIIVKKMTQRYAFVEFMPTEDEESMMNMLKSACVTSRSIGCIYDLRTDLEPHIGQM